LDGDQDADARDRAFAALMTMKKIEIATLGAGSKASEPSRVR